MLTHRIGTPDERVMKPSNSFAGYEKTLAMLSSEDVMRFELYAYTSVATK